MTQLTPRDILGPNGRLAQRLPGYEPRDQQQEVADAVADALANRKHLMVEAGTGTGKSFAYLVPAILHATATQHERDDRPRRIVVSTHTISLQEQLLSKDLPLLNSVIPREFSAVLVKGRGNYISLRRLKNARERARNLFQHPEHFDELDAIGKWSQQTADGSRSDLTFTPSGMIWDEIASDSGNCLGRACPTYQDCFYYRARRRTQNAQILVVNHALFFSDLALRRQGVNLIPAYDAVVFDEAHTVEDVASDHMGLRITSGQVDYNLRRLYNDRTNRGLLVDGVSQRAQQQVDVCRVTSDEFFADLDEWLKSQGPGYNGRVNEKRIVTNRLSGELLKLVQMVMHRAEQLADEPQRHDYVAAADRLVVLADAIDRWLEQLVADCVYWIESSVDRSGFPRISLAAAPVDIGAVLREQLFQEVPSVIMTSATLATGENDFSFAMARLGVTKADTLQVGSPFDYEQQATVIVVHDMPDPVRDREAFERLTMRMIERYVLRTHGHAFALFTNYDLLRRAARDLAATLRQHSLGLYSQAEGMPRHLMLERFKQDPEAVLLGTDSFWQGVDVPGDALQNVIITKLPFRVPDQPLTQARMEALRATGGDPFRDFSLPEAIIRFRQGFGRLIRTRQDRGIVVVLDPRILSRSYGRQFLASLPKCRIVRESAQGIDPSVREI
jgi:ATP-dependent DNA helicase DinG